MPLDHSLLADAFSEFIAASARLEHSYQDLQAEVAHLNRELADRNEALSASMSENEDMRLALQQILDSMPCGVLVVDSRGEVTLANPEAGRLLDCDPMQVRSVDELLMEGAGRPGPRLASLREGGEEQELCRSGAHGEGWLAVRYQALRAGVRGSRRRDQALVILRDITAHKRMEREREAARNAVALAEMSTILAHEIRNPLASLELFAGLLAEGEGQTEEWISHLCAGIRSLGGTVNNVLSLYGEGTSQMGPVDLLAAGRDGVSFVRPIAEQAGVEISFVGVAENLAIRGNASALQQVILNLVCNAIRHTQADGRVEVSVKRMRRGSAEYAVLAVADTGCGIAPEHMESIFSAGFSASGTTPGLGLAVCGRIAEQHGGALRVSSVVGKGTEFSMEMPVR